VTLTKLLREDNEIYTKKLGGEEQLWPVVKEVKQTGMNKGDKD